jgi:hypothetical protein
VAELPVPVIPTNVKLAVVQTDGGDFAMVFPQVVVEGSFALDRSQALTLGSELIKIARSMPSPKELEKAAKRKRKSIEVPRPEGETELPSGLVLPGTGA